MKKATGNSKSEALDLIQQTSQYFKHLKLISVPKTTIAVLIEDVIKRCAHLDTLVIESPDVKSKIIRLSKKTKNASAYPSMSTLVLKRCSLYLELFEFISSRFPRLKSLSIEDFDYRYTLGSHHVPIIMKNSSLECISLCIVGVQMVRCNKGEIPLYIKLVADSENVKDRFCYFGFDGGKFVPHQSEIVSFDESIESKQCLTVFVHYKSVKKLVVKYYNNFSMKFKETVIE